MNAQDFKKISNEVTNADKLEIVYDEILIPMLKRVAESKSQELKVTDNKHQYQVGVKLKELGFDVSLQRLIETEMKPFLEQKGFKVVTYSPSYLVAIRW